MALTPQELAALQASIDLGGVNTYGAQPPLENVTLKGRRSVPGTSQPFLSDVDITQQNLRASRLNNAKDFAQEQLTRARAALGQLPETLQSVPIGRVGLGFGMISPAFTAVEEAQAGRPTGALGALGVGAAGVGAGALLAKMLPGPYGKIASAVLPAIGGMIAAPAGASLAESGKRALTGDPTTGKDDLKNQLAEQRLMSEQGLDLFGRALGTQTSNIKDLTQFYSNQQYLDMQRMNPLIQKMKNADLVRQQALMATQGQQYAMLGTLATAGKLATGSQAEMGATLRTALQSNPYASANLQAPSVSFG
jgi:hypothetical protein